MRCVHSFSIYRLSAFARKGSLLNAGYHLRFSAARVFVGFPIRAPVVLTQLAPGLRLSAAKSRRFGNRMSRSHRYSLTARHTSLAPDSVTPPINVPRYPQFAPRLCRPWSKGRVEPTRSTATPKARNFRTPGGHAFLPILGWKTPLIETAPSLPTVTQHRIVPTMSIFPSREHLISAKSSLKLAAYITGLKVPL